MLSAKAMGKPFLRWRDCEWQRVFNAEERGDIEPIYTLETVNNPVGASWEVHNFMMAYQRQVADDVYEYLLLNGEETFNAQKPAGMDLLACAGGRYSPDIIKSHRIIMGTEIHIWGSLLAFCAYFFIGMAMVLCFLLFIPVLRRTMSGS